MAKTQDELNQLKAEVVTMNKKLADLSEEELKLVTGGSVSGFLDVSACPVVNTCTLDPAKCNVHVGNNNNACVFCPKI